ncbi:N-terminal glutamine amidase-domain-containing protein [Halteromyces radiatus]|uniref:N-terminal glutamine amidase-domain-containing protein n=1 Tax=Halteromyces radiatus TaxID=101107 RepID=UPI00221E78A2|nr:N-terminal glutamine amidase-domain-containing protein [Halteromyces radiatus]KAI8081343.1 N-terminal glutamine amidase-domain-containing protein [Halteromyces radiatus]
MTLLLKKDALIYTANYCEENIYLLCKHIQHHFPDQLDQCTVVFISNEQQAFPMWCQKACRSDRPFVLWDYHVILLFKEIISERIQYSVYDFDTTLPFKSSLTDYITQSFQPKIALLEQYKRRFRMIPASSYIQHFASDRSHMKTNQGTYLAPPPDYQPIVTQDGETMTLPQYRNMMLDDDDQDKYGKVLLEEDFFLSIE